MKQELIQVVTKASQILRLTRCEQIKGATADENDPNKACAIGAMMKFFGWNSDECLDFRSTIPYRYEVSKLLGSENWKEVVRMNNNGKTFYQIADWLEKRGL